MAQAKSQGNAAQEKAAASKNSRNIEGIGPVELWERCKGETLKLCKEAMKGVEKQVREKLKEFNIIGYETTDQGICLFTFGGQYFIGLVKLAVNLGPILYGNIRVSRVVGTEKPQPYVLEGFIINEFPEVMMVENGQYDINLGPQRFPKGWVPCNNDTIKNAMTSIKKAFFAKAEFYGYQPINGDKGYDATNNGIMLNLTKDNVGSIVYIGFVQLSKKDEPGLLYASIKVSQFQGLLPPKPFELLGFIISAQPWLQFVADGVYRAPTNGVILTPPKAQDDAKSSESSNNNSILKSGGAIGPAYMVHQMTYMPTGTAQNICNAFKDIILQEANITGDLDTYQVVSATTVTNQFIFQGNTVFCKIYIGINDVTNFTNFIYTKIYFGNTLFFVQSAQTFPF